jgi:protocatechuate 3,4-dioxygenase beta subunit
MRRLCLAVVLLGAAWIPGQAAAVTYPCQPTLTDGAGPFGQGRPPVRAKIGTGHILAGTVISAATCKPVRRASVEFWQSDKSGSYRRAGSATVVTDRNGRFRFQGPFPTRYEGLPPHIHIRVIVGGFKPLVTRYVPADGERRGSVKLVLEPDDV